MVSTFSGWEGEALFARIFRNSDDEGIAATREYAVLLALTITICLDAVSILGERTYNSFDHWQGDIP